MPKKKDLPLIVQAAKAQTGHPLKNLLLIYLADYWSAKKGAYMSHTTLAERCGGKTSRETVQRLLKKMEAEGWIKSANIPSENGLQTTKRYDLTPDKWPVTTDHNAVTTDHTGCDDRSQGVRPQITGGVTTDHTISLLKSPSKSLMKSTPIVPTEFDAFYAKYPKKVGRQAAQKAWDKLDPQPALINRIMIDIENRVDKGHWDIGEGKAYIPHPATYINQAKWEDDIIPRPEFKPNEKQRADKVREMIDELDRSNSWIK